MHYENTPLTRTKPQVILSTVTLCSLCAANMDRITGRRIGLVTYADGDGIPAYLIEDTDTGRLALEFEGDALLPVEREQLDAFMAWHGLRLLQLPATPDMATH